MKIVIHNEVALEEIPEAFRREITTRLTFTNPKWTENEKMGRWNGDTEQWLKCFEKIKSTLIIPRGFIRQLIGLCRKYGVPFEIQDRRRSLPEVLFTFQGTLKPFQTEAVQAVLTRDFGTLSAPTASGKTVMALFIIAERRQPALILVHTKELMSQWVERIGTFLGIPKDEIGLIGLGKHTIGERITVATVQTLYKCAYEVSPHIGFLVVDECHRCPSRTFSEALSSFDSKYMLGLSATPWRRDRLSRLIFWHLGDVVHEIKREELQETGDILRAEVITRYTDFMTSFDPSEEYTRMLSELCEDPERNAMIASDVAREAGNGGGVCLVLSDRKAHCEAIQRLLARKGTNSEVLTGDIQAAEREAIVDRLKEGRVKVLVATGQLIGEGFDCRRLSTLFLATPVKFNGRVLQYLGRVLRPAPGKDRAKVFDYIDVHVGPLVASAKARQRVYEQQEGSLQ